MCGTTIKIGCTVNAARDRRSRWLTMRNSAKHDRRKPLRFCRIVARDDAPSVTTCKLLSSSETIRGSFFFIFGRHHFDAVEFSTATGVGTRAGIFFLASPKAPGYRPRLVAPRTSLSASQTVRLDWNFAASVVRQFSRMEIDDGTSPWSWIWRNVPLVEERVSRRVSRLRNVEVVGGEREEVELRRTEGFRDFPRTCRCKCGSAR